MPLKFTTRQMVERLRRAIRGVFSFETAFVLFLFAGKYKTDPRFDVVPVDLTALTFVVSVGAGMWVIYKRKVRVRKEVLIATVLLLVFVWYCLFTLSWTPSSVYAQEKSLYLITLTVWPFLACAHIISSSPGRVRRFFVVLLIFALWVSVEIMRVYLTAHVAQQVTAFGQTNNYTGLSRIVGLAALVALMYGLRLAPRRIYRWLSYGLFGGYAVLTLIIGSRAGFLAMVVAAFFPLLAGIRWHRIGVLRYAQYVRPLLLISIGGVLSLTLLFQNQTFTTLARLAHLLAQGGGGEARLQLYASALQVWSNHPLFGVGWGGWPVAAGLGDHRMYPHNIFLEMLAEVGAVGLGLFGLFAAYVFLRYWRRHSVRLSGIALLVLMLLVNTVLNAMSTGDIPQNRIVFGIMGLLLFQFDE